MTRARNLANRAVDFVSVLDKNADPLGLTDSTAMIQAAIDSLADSVAYGLVSRYMGGGGIVYLPPGTYWTTAPIRVPHNVHLMGAGPLSTIIKRTGTGDIIQIRNKYAILADPTIYGVQVSGMALLGSATAEAGITNRITGYAGPYPISCSMFQNLEIRGCKVGMHIFAGWNNTYRNIQVMPDDYTTNNVEGLFGFIGETTDDAGVYGPAGFTVTVPTGGGGGFNNNMFDEFRCYLTKRGGIHIRAISSSPSNQNKFIGCQLEGIGYNFGLAPAYSPYTDLTCTPDGLGVQTLAWDGGPVGLHVLGRAAALGVIGCYLEDIATMPDTGTNGTGIVLDSAGLLWTAPDSKLEQNEITGNFFNANVERPIHLGYASRITIRNNKTLISTNTGRKGYFFSTNSNNITLMDEATSNVNVSSVAPYNWINTQGGQIMLVASVTGSGVPSSAAFQFGGRGQAFRYYRPDISANFNVFVIADTTNTSILHTIGYNSTQMLIGPNSGSGSVAPMTDNVVSMGTGGSRWSVVYAGTGSINTSDARFKQDVRELEEAELLVAHRIKNLIKAFRFTDAVAEKGALARVHFGVIAQEVIAAFQAEGLDPFRYACVCHDTWEEQEALPEIRDEQGRLAQEARDARPAGDRYGIRYEELLAFVLSVL